MGFFSRNRKALDGAGVDDAPFETVRRPRQAKTRASADSRFDATAPLDPAESTRRRARHRLIGAIALALAAIVFVPMLFNATPVAPADDIALQIPDRDTPFEGRRGVPESTHGPLKPSSELPSTPVEPAPVAPASPSPAPAPVAVTADPKPSDPPVVVSPPVAKAPPPAVERPAEKAVEKPAEKAVEKPKPIAAEKAPTDDPRALAALEGRADAVKKPVPAEAGTGRFAVQVAAYASADTARGERDRLVAGGLKAYTESVSTSQGLRTRVRLGPFGTREAADQARAKLKALKLAGSVVPL